MIHTKVMNRKVWAFDFMMMIHAKAMNCKNPGCWTLQSMPKLWIVKIWGVGLYDPHQSHES